MGAYIDVAEVKLYLQATKDADDTLIESLIDAVESAFDEAAGHDAGGFAASNLTSTSRSFDVGYHTDGRRLYFDGYAAELTTVTNGDGVEVTTAQYVTLPRRPAPYYAIELKPSASVVWTFADDPVGAITVSAKWGFSLSVPARVKQSMIRYAAFLYRQRDTSQDLDRPIITDAGVTILPARVPADVAQVLQSVTFDVFLPVV